VSADVLDAAIDQVVSLYQLSVEHRRSLASASLATSGFVGAPAGTRTSTRGSSEDHDGFRPPGRYLSNPA
jgi:hypothetical protein